MLLLVGCNLKEDRISGETAKAIKEDLNNRQLRRISQGEITSEAYTKGTEIVRRMTDSLKSRLSKAIEQEGVGGAIEYCNVTAMPLTKRMSSHLYADISRISLKRRNPKNAPISELETQLLEAYQFGAESGSDLEPNVQILDTSILFTQPIFTNDMCLKCHGEKETDISTEHYDLIKKLYPEDSAIGYKKGELRGMWAVRFNKKMLIKNMKTTI